MLKKLDSHVLYEEHYCLVTREGADFCERDVVTWEEVATLKLGLLSASMHNRQILNRHLGAGGRRIQAVTESNSMIALLSQTRLAGIATVMPYRSAAVLGLADPLVAIPITGPDVGYRIGLVTARRELRPPNVAAFWEESRLMDPV